jgi:hypothetical protein
LHARAEEALGVAIAGNERWINTFHRVLDELDATRQEVVRLQQQQSALAVQPQMMPIKPLQQSHSPGPQCRFCGSSFHVSLLCPEITNKRNRGKIK